MSVFLIVFSLKTKGCIVIWGQHVCFGERFFFFIIIIILDHAHFIPSSELCIYKCTVITVVKSGVKCMQGHSRAKHITPPLTAPPFRFFSFFLSAFAYLW